MASSALISPEALHARIKKDRLRTALQAPISAPMYCVLYLKEKRECRSPWFARREHAQAALDLMQAKYGKGKAIVYVD
ncbi:MULTISPECIES: hypothetical protein [Pseudomonas]|uniref:Uncharacterized protein n=1 Tax=Pseudomonas putida TaxID=303 RepID=A0A1B2F600_PSEPU|nr:MULTISPECIES: hypothetical protein [Pseudomonas]ANY87630.1 hypothetical protein IEC33019_2070 [Pseudomonas putida]MCL8308310.1 hypothetical protein [Pseudomonas putida]